MSSNISNESPFFTFMSKVGDLIYINILCILFSLPIVTIGASVTATYCTVSSLYKKEEKYVFRTFLAAFKSNFKNSTIIWVIMAVLGYMVALYSSYISHHINQIVALAIYMFVLMIYLFTLCYVFALQATFINNPFKLMVNAFLTAIARLPYTLGLSLITFMPALLTLLFPQYIFITSVFWVVIGFSLTSLIRVYLMRKALKPYMNEETTEK